MGCILQGNKLNDYKCQMYCDDLKDTTWENSEYGWDKEGVCVCEDDPNPYYSCYYFEPDNPEDYEEE